ncbi:MAG: hypothetical protein E7549_04080 [Ruminococcaceae bacterium]|nr:hypothetical protein [Oscillospiraceae bacterium]
MKTVMRRLGATMLALVMLVSMLATFTITASAATALNVSVTGLSVTWEYTNQSGGSATWSASGNTISGSAKGATLKTNTSLVTMTNTLDSEATLKFDYTNSGGTLTGNISGSSGTYENVLAAGASMSFTFKSPALGRTGTLSITNISLISTTAADPVLTFPLAENGSYTVDGTAVTAATEKTVTAGATVTLAATPASGYQFYGWYDEVTGKYLSQTASFSMIAAADATVYPVFRPNSMAMFGVGSAKYDSLTEAAAAAAAGGTKTVVLLNSGTMTGNHTIPAGVKLLVPYDDANTEYGSSPKCTSYSSIINNSGQIAWEKPTVYRTLTMAADATITVNGSIEVGGRHASGGGTKGKYGGSPTGALGFIHMLAGSHIDLNSGANLYCWGYIYGDGTVTAKSGSSVYENFQMMEFRGGTVTTDLAADEKVFPSNQYYVQNVEVLTTYEYGATEYVATSVFMSNMCHSATVKFIGSDAMFQPSAGSYFTKKYDPTTDRLILEAYGDCVLGRMQMSMGGTKIDSADFVLPITNNISILIHTGVATLNQNVMLLPGASLTIDEGATLDIASTDATTPVVTAGGYVLQIFDSENWTYGLNANMATVPDLNFVYQTGTSVRFTPIEYSPSAYKKRTAADLTDVTVDINGTLVANGYLYSTVTWADAATGDYTIVSGGANIISSKGTGVLAMNGGAGKDTLSCLYSQVTKPIDYYSIPLASAQLKNGDGTMLDTTGAAAGTVYRYCTVHDAWYANECGKCNAVEIMWVVNGVSETVEVEKNTAPVYPGATPTKAYTNNIHYVFAGWSVSDGGAVLETIPAATENATYYAVFTEAAHAYGAAATDGKHYCTCGKPAGCYDAENDGNHLCDLGCGAEKSAHVGGTATCDKQAVCTECGASYGTQPAHTEVTDAAKAPTCTETGLTEGKHCSVCGTVLVAQETVAALGHTSVTDSGKVPTCTETGLTEGAHCAVCGVVLTAQEVIDALGHSEVIDAAKAPTCTETGLTEGKHCATCGEVLVAQEVVAALGHSEVIDEAVAPTCTETGLTEGKHCATCGTVLVAQEVVAALGHSEVIDAAKAPTCTETGLTEGKHCATCGTVLVAQEVVAALGHSEVIDEAVAPTCTETGLTEGKHCATCGTVLVAQEVVAALGHSEVIDEAIAPTCTETGLTEGKHCTVCGEVLVAQEVVDALGHSEVIDEAVAPTCTETGLTEGKHCATCGTVLVAQEVVAALGHSEVIDAAVAPTCTETGLTEGKHCAVCGTVLVAQEVVAKLAHTDADHDVVCDVCGEAFTVYKYTVTDGEATITDVNTALGGDVIIPEELDGYPVVAIGNNAFRDCVHITSIVIPEGIKTIGNYAFKDCTSLTTVYYKAINCTSAGVNAYPVFHGCTALTTVYISKSVTAVPPRLFRAASALTTVYITRNTETIGANAFYLCDNLTDVYFVGSAGDWTQVDVKSYNTALTNATLAYNTPCFEDHDWTADCDSLCDLCQTKRATTHANIVEDAAVEPTCEVNGWTAGSHCAVCGNVVVKQNYIPALGHAWDKGEVLVEPTEEADGEKQYTCTVCGGTKIVPLNLGEIIDGYYYYKGVLKPSAGLVQVEDAYYYIVKDGSVKTGRYTIAGSEELGIEKGTYYFFEDGKLNLVRGVYEGQYYNDQGKSEAYAGLIEWNGAKYYVNDGGKVETGRYFITKLNDLVPKKRAYTFYEDGKMLEETRIYDVDGFYYENGIRVPYAGMVMYEGHWYYVSDHGAYVKNKQQILVNVNNSGLAKSARCYFDENGHLVTNAVVDGKYYGEDGAAPSYAGVVKAADGNLYYVSGTNGTLTVGKTFTIAAEKTNGLCADGKYTADANGVLSPA